MLAAAAAGFGAVGPQVGAPAPLLQIAPAPGAQPGGAMHAPQGGIGTMLQAMLRRGGLGGFGVLKPTYRKNTGYSCAEGARRKRRQRNALRSKGQFRKAVR
jgi:hypothetical protein